MKQNKKMRWVAWFVTPKLFATKKEAFNYCEGKIVMISKINSY